MKGIFGSLIQGGMSVANSVINNANQERINEYNAVTNRENMLMQNAYNASAEADARAYNSPAEQMKRLTSAGINAFTAQDMVTSNQGNAANVAGASPSNAVSSQTSLDFSALADALLKVDEMHFTNSQNRQAARESMDQLMENINNQLKMQGIEIEERKRAQERTIQADLERQSLQNDWQSEEYKRDRELEREKLYTNNIFSYVNALNAQRTQRDIADKQIGFNKWNAEEQRRWQHQENESERAIKRDANSYGEISVGFGKSYIKCRLPSVKSALQDYRYFKDFFNNH